jgi:hypothetical protein
MTPDEFAAEMEVLAVNNADDPETTHSQADHLLCEVLREMGYGKGRFMWLIQMVSAFLTEGQLILDEIRKEIDDGHRTAVEATYSGPVDGAGAGTGASDSAAECAEAAERAGQATGEGSGVGAGLFGLSAPKEMNAYQQQVESAQRALMQQQMHMNAVGGRPIWQALPPPTPKVEDAGVSVGEFVGWRWWIVMGPAAIVRLASVTAPAIWLPGETMVARNDAFDWKGPEWSGGPNYGIFAFKDRQEALLANDVPGMLMAFGSVSLWGTVIEHERGYRAQYAKVRSLDWAGIGPIAGRSVFARPEVLAAVRQTYGVGGTD